MRSHPGFLGQKLAVNEAVICGCILPCIFQFNSIVGTHWSAYVIEVTHPKVTCGVLA